MPNAVADADDEWRLRPRLLFDKICRITGLEVRLAPRSEERVGFVATDDLSMGFDTSLMSSEDASSMIPRSGSGSAAES